MKAKDSKRIRFLLHQNRLEEAVHDLSNLLQGHRLEADLRIQETNLNSFIEKRDSLNASELTIERRHIERNLLDIVDKAVEEQRNSRGLKITYSECIYLLVIICGIFQFLMWEASFEEHVVLAGFCFGIVVAFKWSETRIEIKKINLKKQIVSSEIKFQLS